MKLNREDAELFFELSWALQFFVNRKKELISGVNSIEEYIELSQEKKLLVRESLYESPKLIDSYVSENPDNFDKEKLYIIKQWKNFIKSDFHIERYLKNYAVFISGNNAVYGVLALHQGFDEIFPKNYLPRLVKAVLLPFKNNIVYDGLMQSYNIHFGGGIKRSLKETYMRAKQNEKIITNKNIDKNEKSEKNVQEKDWSKELEQLTVIAKKLKGGVDQPVINSPVFSLVKTSIEFANQSVVNSSDINELIKELRKIKKATSKIETILYRME